MIRMRMQKYMEKVSPQTCRKVVPRDLSIDDLVIEEAVRRLFMLKYFNEFRMLSICCVHCRSIIFDFTFFIYKYREKILTELHIN